MPIWTEAVTDLLFRCSFMTLSTSDRHGRPWSSPLEFICDRDMQLYWVSLVDSRHSRNVRENPRAAVSIFNGTYLPLSEEPQGLYAEGDVEEFHRHELEDLLPDFARWIAWRDAGRTIPRRPGVNRYEGNSPWRHYRIAQPKFYALDPDGHPNYGWPAHRTFEVDLKDSFTAAYRSRLE